MLREQGRDFLFLTNNSSRSQDDYAEKITRLGLPVDREKIFTPAKRPPRHLRAAHPRRASSSWVRRPACGVPRARVVLAASTSTHAVLGFDTTLTYAKLWRSAAIWSRRSALHHHTCRLQLPDAHRVHAGCRGDDRAGTRLHRAGSRPGRRQTEPACSSRPPPPNSGFPGRAGDDRGSPVHRHRPGEDQRDHHAARALG